ncbi:phosphate uptake regulator [Paraburkholderia sp. UCT70]|uniref:hypothetical protein n=1 Tax=Paraburkholderia sp. UCT70 TaxID=2991068 RepID=UPI003D21AB0C
MSEKHLSSRFEADLDLLSSKLLERGGLVEAQTAHALAVLNEFDSALVDDVLEGERRLNAMEIAIDEEVCQIIAAYSTQIERPFCGKASKHSTRNRAGIPQQSERCGHGDAG